MMFLTLPTEEVDLATRGAVTLMLKDVMVMANERLVTEVGTEGTTTTGSQHARPHADAAGSCGGGVVSTS